VIMTTACFPCFQFYGAPEPYLLSLHYMNTLFTGLFTLECFLKLHAYGSRVRQRGSSQTIHRSAFIIFIICSRVRLVYHRDIATRFACQFLFHCLFSKILFISYSKVIKKNVDGKNLEKVLDLF
jgi:hypothetical protein